ncbi:hypothetical protein M0813_27643 [Anaeramoeba flamelloides]|uniref:Uncharacterized protein n=1 Tax=Anaeramoeba flamelloides TaxID=1746091 RepID=A0AAV7YDP1_9EUKA|nr:hypothetical protein M0812_28118 [Anaeramoeba flamelloides]KAJ6236898.1 hypothetical protein M0813_27643 [Anaeramoeba flamelloides]
MDHKTKKRIEKSQKIKWKQIPPKNKKYIREALESSLTKYLQSGDFKNINPRNKDEILLVLQQFTKKVLVNLKTIRMPPSRIRDSAKIGSYSDLLMEKRQEKKKLKQFVGELNELDETLQTHEERLKQKIIKLNKYKKKKEELEKKQETKDQNIKSMNKKENTKECEIVKQLKIEIQPFKI